MGSGIDPDDLSILEGVFAEFTAQPWFDPEARYDFSKYLIDTFPENSYNAKRHRDIVDGVARTIYAVKNPTLR